MKTLAFKIEGQTMCCACAEQLAKISGYPHLFFAVNKPKKIDAEKICPRCGHWYGDHDALCAAERIANELL